MEDVVTKSDIDEECRELFERLSRYPLESHWYCPKRNDQDCAKYDDPDTEYPEDGMPVEEKNRLIGEGIQRRNICHRLNLIYGFSVDESKDWRALHQKRTSELLKSCNSCVRNYHMDRGPFLRELGHQFDEYLITELSNDLNQMDFQRIDEGLTVAQCVLVQTPELQASANILAAQDYGALMALMEALCCRPYHTSNEKLQFPFQDPFKMIQPKKVLRLTDLVPAMTSFLFDPEEIRLRFARENWKKLSRPVTRQIFEWAIQDPLMDAIRSASSQEATITEIKQFWESLLLILDKLDRPLITHQLRGMEIQPDMYHLALYHLASRDSEEILESVIRALHLLLLKSPDDFWAAYGAISASTIAEQIFVSKAFERLLAIPQNNVEVDNLQVSSALAWISPFLKSLPAAQQYDACRTILYHLLDRLQHGGAPQDSKLACFQAGLTTLLATLKTFVGDDYKINSSTSFIVVHNVLSLVDTHKVTIVTCANISTNSLDEREISALAVHVVRFALELCGKSLFAEFQELEWKRDVSHELESYAPSIWQTVLDGFRRDNLAMAQSVLIGLKPLIGLDQLRQINFKDDKGKLHEDPLKQSKIQFNKAFNQITEVVSHIFERLSDFTPDKLIQLSNIQGVREPLYGGLTPSDQATYEATVEVMKTLTGKSSRKDAIGRMLSRSLTATLLALAWTARRITRRGMFAPVPYLIKTGGDILDSLCGPQNGLLRVRPTATIEEKKAIIRWWTDQWDTMANVFKYFEVWTTGRDSRAMENHARDIMEYAENLFDQYSVLATTLDENSPDLDPKRNTSVAAKSSREELLKHPSKAMEYMVKWLRLRDSYLLSTLVNLLCKVLRRLAQFKMEIETYALREVEDIGRGFNKKLMLTAQQRAELWRAFEEHQGLWIIEKPGNTTRMKQETIDTWSKSGEGANKTPSASNSRATSLSSTLSDDVRSLSKTIEQGKPILDQIRSRQVMKSSAALGTKDAANAAKSLRESRQREKEEKKKRDQKAIDDANALRAPSSHVPGEGSGLKGVGVLGKDHEPASKGTRVMVSSDEESDDDGTEIKTLINRKIERSKKLADHEKNQNRALLQQPVGPVKKTKLIRSAHDMRARLVPNMDSLHLTILRWDIFHDGDEPPNAIECQEVSNMFKTTNEYYDTFYPLLISEAWRSLATAKEESNYKPFEIKVVNRLSVDSFFEVGTTMQIADNKDNNIAEGDIVFLSKGQNPMLDRKEALCLSRVYRVTRKKDAIEVSYRINGHSTGNTGLLSAFSPNSKIRGLKITSMTTLEREYAALKSLQYYDLCEEILSAKPSPILTYSDSVFDQIKSIYGLNKGQARAIWSAKENDAFTLIQGPPGSGKTKTIVAMVGALLTNKFTASGVAITQPRGAEHKSANEKQVQKKLLICAPSNAAVDEIVTRLKLGVKTLKGEFHKIKVIRLGRSDAIDANVKDVTLDELVRAKMESDGKNGTLELSEREKLHQEAARLKEAVDTLRPKLEEARAQGDDDLERRLQREFDGKKRDQVRIGAKIDENKTNGNTASRENEITRRRLQQEIIDSAHVLCATLSGSGHEMFKNLSVEFETVIIDEAAQCIELSALIPLKYGCSKCILVGDPKQLPPTVLSRSAARYGYEQSLFVRMQQNHPKDVHLLDTQYRMHPEISRFPSQQFYDGKLIDGDDMAKARKKPWHANVLLGPYHFFDVKGTQTKGAKGHSFINVEEIKVAMQLYDRLMKEYGSFDYKGKIGVITPYKAQLRELRATFRGRYGEKIFQEIEFNTTDAFQGRESEIIMFSCVRARASGGIGFLDDIRRMNVGLTRAKSSLWVLGDSKALVQGEFWARLVEDAKIRRVYTEGNVASFSKMAAIQAPASQDLHMSGTTESSRSNSVDGSRRSSVVDVEMADAPTPIEGRRSSVASVNTSASETSSKKRYRPTHCPTPEERAARPAILKADHEKLLKSRDNKRVIELAEKGVREKWEPAHPAEIRVTDWRGTPLDLTSDLSNPNGTCNDARLVNPQDPYSGLKVEFRDDPADPARLRRDYHSDSSASQSNNRGAQKRQRELSPTDVVGNLNKKTVPERQLLSTEGPVSNRLIERSSPSGGHENSINSLPAAHRPLVKPVNVPPPRKKTPADPLRRNRPNPKRP